MNEAQYHLACLTDHGTNRVENCRLAHQNLPHGIVSWVVVFGPQRISEALTLPGSVAFINHALGSSTVAASALTPTGRWLLRAFLLKQAKHGGRTTHDPPTYENLR
jgi:hypothetical protein